MSEGKDLEKLPNTGISTSQTVQQSYSRTTAREYIVWTLRATCSFSSSKVVIYAVPEDA